MATRDYYNILGVNKNADEKEIKRAFRKLAKQYHPDANPNDPGAADKFKEINEAYEVLGDADKRKQYDRFGANFQQFNGGQNPYGNVRVEYDQVDDSVFGDIFDSFFGGGQRTGKRRTTSGFGYAGSMTNGRDIEHNIRINLREAYEGTTRIITKDRRRVNVKIPAGAANGTKVRLAGEGEAPYGDGKYGDLYLIVEVEPDNTFERDGDDLYAEVKVDVFTAMLGGKVEVPTMTRPVTATIPAGTQSGQKLRLTGKGMPQLKNPNEHGNLYVRILVTVPTNLSQEQRALAQQLRDSLY